MKQDEIADIYQKANGWNPRAYPNTMTELEAFAKLVDEKATEKANARANASWTLMCKKMVEAEREAWAREFEKYDLWGPIAAKIIRARGQQ